MYLKERDFISDLNKLKYIIDVYLYFIKGFVMNYRIIILFFIIVCSILTLTLITTNEIIKIQNETTKTQDEIIKTQDETIKILRGEKH